MPQVVRKEAMLLCHNCGYSAPPGDAWETVEYPPMGSLTKCPECGSTLVHNK